MTRIVIAGVSGLRNRGVQALVEVLCRQIAAHIPGTALTVLTRDAEYDAPRLEAARVLPDHIWQASAFRLKPHLLPRWAIPPRRPFKPLADALNAVAGADMIVLTGGDILSGDYGRIHDLHILRLARRLKRPYALLAHSIGPFDDPRTCRDIAALARDAALVTVREGASLAYCRDILGVTAEHVADPAFLLEYPADPEGLRRHYGIGPDRPTIALGISAGICRYVGADAQAHRQAWTEVVRWGIEEARANILLIPHVQERLGWNEDRSPATDILRAFDYHPWIRLAAADHSAGEYKALIAGCDLVAAERLHACIAGLSSGVPSLCIGYSVKTSGIVEDIFGNGDNAYRPALSLAAFLQPGAAVRAVAEAWAQRAFLAAHLAEALPALRRSALRNFELLAARLAS
ncbi:polysaccharide pyruvyl transferase family protein [Telmatospirillum sp. J64-1]|uniref:polysaccharide pyruvyl transferase family protein n=1 Tax=Telmatospirillum sp. J64-1 TaxID=2502183 RepID=UPI00115F0154|nr:polysaccharide pyruvyl transferase family protein [Telmatospirillum sp. J64-1]